MKSLSEKAARNLEAIRKKKPLIHNITNYVVMNYTANALLAMGASPVMAHASNMEKKASKNQWALKNTVNAAPVMQSSMPNTWTANNLSFKTTYPIITPKTGARQNASVITVEIFPLFSPA